MARGNIDDIEKRISQRDRHVVSERHQQQIVPRHSPPLILDDEVTAMRKLCRWRGSLVGCHM